MGFLNRNYKESSKYNLSFPNNPLKTRNISQNRIYTYKNKLFYYLMYCIEDEKRSKNENYKYIILFVFNYANRL